MTDQNNTQLGDRRVAVVQLGARMHYAVPEILVRNQMLTSLDTDVVSSAGGKSAWLERLLPGIRAIKRFRGRTISPQLRARTRQHQFLGLWFALRLRFANSLKARRGIFMAQSRAFGAAAVRSGLGDANVVYGFTSAGLELLERAKADGIHGVLEQFIASQPFRDDLLADERAAFPDWEPVQETLKNDKAYRDRLHREWTLADTIICPSRFVSDSLVAEGVDPAKLVVVPYGVAMPSEPIEMRQLNGPLRVLFIGTVELRKGVHYLTEALGMLDPGSFHAKVAGPVRLSKTGTSRLSAVAEVLGQVPRSEVGALFNWADVFVLPSLVEGSATVIYEALVRGVPVICTPNAGSIVDDGRTGLLVAPRNASSLADALNRLAMEPDFLDSLRQTAKAERHAASLEKYEENLLAALRARLAKVV